MRSLQPSLQVVLLFLVLTTVGAVSNAKESVRKLRKTSVLQGANVNADRDRQWEEDLAAGKIDVGLDEDKCTTIVVGPSAGTEGAMTTHTADCADCDFRLGKVA